MGRIVPEVIAGHLEDYPNEEMHLRPFLQGFDITWAKRRRAFGSDLSVYFLKPEPHMERAFGFESEILTVYSAYDELEPRTIQAIEQFLFDEPARGRVDTMIAFIISEASDPVSWTKQYMTSHPESRLLAAFSALSLYEQRGSSWAVRSMLSEQLYQRDLFDHRLPINSDYFFFGREELIFDLHNAFRRSENRGLFGLRKTGKTSIFFKLGRIVESSKDGLFIYVDCKLPLYRESKWDDLLMKIALMIVDKVPGRHEPADGHASEVFLDALRAVGNRAKIALVFDEIEYISHVSPLDSHWASDFIPFWQTIWHAQSLFSNLAVFVGGVNPTVVEQDLIENTQNPLFGIVPYRYLGGLSEDDVRRMVRTLGRPMGLRFDRDGVKYIFGQYGGHPLLTRIACSIVHRAFRDSGQEPPWNPDMEWMQWSEEEREAELVFYGGHVISELRLFYPDEYEVMEEIAKGNLADMFDFIADPIFAAHLNSYGLVRRDETGRPLISIPVLERSIQLQEARGKGRQTIASIWPITARPGRLQDRKTQINSALAELEKLVMKLKRPRIFGPNSYPESHAFFGIEVVENGQQFASFINTCNRCFVEPVENYGRSIGKHKYFWNEVSGAYPALSVALRRIKVYRHDRVHIRLEDRASDELRWFLHRDLGGRSPLAVQELWFQLQQCVLDDLWLAIMVEIERLT